jgi:hypothetical protein
MNTNTAILCSAALATAPASHVSAQYKHVRTLDLLAPLFDAGWRVDSQIVTRSAHPEHAKHALKLSHPEITGAGEYRPQIVVSNGSNGDTKLKVSAGLWRFACANGIVAGAACLTAAVSHRGNDLQARAVAAVETVAERLPSLSETVARWSSQTLTEAAQIEFARRAAALRWDISEALTVDLGDLTTSRRYGDYGADLWLTFNRAQEALIKGEVRVTRRIHATAGRYDHSAGVFVDGPTFCTDTRCARPVTAIESNLKINTALWNLAEEFSHS